MISEQQKYGGDEDDGTLNHRLVMFTDICEPVSLPAEYYHKAFSAMLKGLALEHFYTSKLSSRTYHEMCNNLRG